MPHGSPGYLLDDAGRQIATDALPLAPDLAVVPEAETIDYAVTECGFVLIQPFHPVFLVMLSPEKVAPLAALEAFYQVKTAAPGCVVLVWPTHSWRRHRHEFLPSTAAALKRMAAIAQSARRRTAGQLQARNPNRRGGERPAN